MFAYDQSEKRTNESIKKILQGMLLAVRITLCIYNQKVAHGFRVCALLLNLQSQS